MHITQTVSVFITCSMTLVLLFLTLCQMVWLSYTSIYHLFPTQQDFYVALKTSSSYACGILHIITVFYTISMICYSPNTYQHNNCKIICLCDILYSLYQCMDVGKRTKNSIVSTIVIVICDIVTETDFNYNKIHAASAMNYTLIWSAFSEYVPVYAYCFIVVMLPYDYLNLSKYENLMMLQSITLSMYLCIQYYDSVIVPNEVVVTLLVAIGYLCVVSYGIAMHYMNKIWCMLNQEHTNAHQYSYILVATAVMLIVVLVMFSMMANVLKMQPLYYIYLLLTKNDYSNVWICCYWICCLATIPLIYHIGVYYRTYQILCRKLFHVLGTCMFLPVLCNIHTSSYHDENSIEFIVLAFGVGLCALIAAEYLR